MTSPDQRPAAFRVLLWVSAVLLLALGLVLAGVGLIGIGTGGGRASLCAGLALLVVAAGGIAREVVERRVRLHPPRARLAERDGEPSLYLPRDPAATRVSTWTLSGLALVALVGAVFAGVAQSWVGGAFLAVVALALGWSSGYPGGARAEGLWLTPTRLVHEDRGFGVWASWDDITGVVPQQPMPVMLRPDRSPIVTRTGPVGRAWKPLSKDGTLVVDTAHLAGGARLASYVIGRAITDPATRAILGTPESLPPEPDAGPTRA